MYRKRGDAACKEGAKMRIKLKVIKQEKREGDGRLARGRRCAGKSHQRSCALYRCLRIRAARFVPDAC
jgi:hypothetical protein